MTALATARHKTINSWMKVWAIIQISCQHGQGLQEWLLQHERIVNAIANVINIWLMDSSAFTVKYDDVEFT
jgi:hypothetical protein